MLNLTMISDDLTGTVDCTSLACGCTPEVKVTVCTDGKVKVFERTQEREIVALNLSSRTVPGNVSYQWTYNAALLYKNKPENLIFKKMDTGFRGNAGYEIEGIFDALGKNLCFILDHIEMRKTFTLYGHQYAGGQILSKSAFARDDKLKAPKESYIPAILAKQTSIPVGHVDIDAVKGGDLLGAVKAQIEKGKQIIVFDAITTADGLHVVKTLQPVYPDVLWAGSTGIVEALITYLYGPVILHPRKSVKERSIGFSGTAYQMSMDQIDYAKEHADLMIVPLNIDRIMSGQKEQTFSECINVYLAANRAGKNVIMKPAVSPNNPYTNKQIADTIMSCYAEISKEICRQADFDRILIIGGETSQAIFRALDVNVLSMQEPPEIGAGEGIVGDGLIKGKKFVLKGGSTGDIYSVIRMLGLWDTPIK